MLWACSSVTDPEVLRRVLDEVAGMMREEVERRGRYLNRLSAPAT